jgi:NAD(P)-dependent dehydrogenase (short-subunit alcohol dehydrogenase family)
LLPPAREVDIRFALSPRVGATAITRPAPESSSGGKAGLAGQTNYSTAKAAIVGLTKAAAKELAPDRIRVNATLAGIINTAMAAMLSPRI